MFIMNKLHDEFHFFAQKNLNFIFHRLFELPSEIYTTDDTIISHPSQSRFLFKK